MFEIKYRDAMGRIGIFNLRGKKLEMPLILPVVNLKIQSIAPKELKKMGFSGIMANSYILYRDEKLRVRALKRGVHKLLNFDGIVMTDSGSYQLYEYGKIEVEPREIVEFQNAINSDIGVILDIPTPPDVPYDKAEKDLKETIKRAKESLKVSRNMLLAGTVQGSTHLDLREKGAKEMAKLNFDIYPIGGVVPLMESYRFSDLVKVILHSKEFLPPDKPVHLFGCGHPMVFSLAVALGCDIFDSAAYAIYAKNGRYITPEGTLRLEDIYELPCSCEVCSEYTSKEILKSEEGEALLSRHNLYATLEEIKRIKHSIYRGGLWELVERRARSHPFLLEALKTAYGYNFIERFDPITKKSVFFYSGAESLKRPEILRHLERLDNIEFRAKNLVLLPDQGKPYSKTYGINSGKKYHICIASPVFGVIPLEVEETYPLNQHEGIKIIDESQKKFMQSTIRKYVKNFERIYVHKDLDFLDINGEAFKDLEAFNKGDIEVKLRAMGDYQFGRGAGKILFKGARAEWARTGRIRRIYSDKGLLATVRASDGLLVLTLEGAERLLRLRFPRNRVIIKDKEVCEIIKSGKSVFAKFIEGCDREIRPYQEVIVVSAKDELLATGRAILNAEEMMVFNRGVAVKVRRGIKETKGV